MKKYFALFSAYLKQSMIYRADTLTGAAFTLFAVLISYLLWSLLIPKGGTLQGFTLPEMVTYTMLCTALAPFVQSNDAMFSFADEVRTGKFARFLYTPVSPFGMFVCQSLAAALPKRVATLLCCCVWSLIFHNLMCPLSLSGLLGVLPVIVLAVAFVLLLNYLIACLSFRFTDILGVVLIRGTVLAFFTGTYAPLEVLFGSAPVASPFYYLADYPAQLLMGRQVASPAVACAVLGAFTAALAALCLTVARNSRRYFEGVGA